MSGICVWCAGYVPQDKPGASGYFTPRSSALYANDCFDHADCTSRNPVTSQLNGELHRNPFRHRTARKLHTHLRVSKIAFRPPPPPPPLALRVILALPCLSSPEALISTSGVQALGVPMLSISADKARCSAL